MRGSLDICFDTWDRQGAGYVFLSNKSSKGSWRDISFRWPEDRNIIKQTFEDLSNNKSDIYWAPLIFSTRERSGDNVISAKTLFADLDPVDPRELDIEPTVAWESSQGRYQALWYLDEPLSPSQFERINKSLSYYIGADKGGWDLSQVLRIPGTYNHKYDPPRKGKLLWTRDHIYNRKEFENLPEPTINSQQPDVSLVQLLSQYRKVIPKKVSKILQYPSSRITEGQRSDMLWYIESELVAAQIPIEDIVTLIRLSPWNKYKGRADEVKRITIEVTKVYENSQSGAIKVIDEAEDSEPRSSLPFVSHSKLMSNMRAHPGWLIRDLWMKKSHGFVAGEPKTFKSTITLDIALSVTSGVPLWNKYEVEETGPVILVQNENSDWIIKDRVEKIMNYKGLGGMAKVDSKNPRKIVVEFPEEQPIYFLNNYGYSLSDPLHCELMEDMVAEIKPALVIFDPLYLMIDGDVNSAKELQPVLQWLMDLKNDYNTAVMVVHHWNKSGSNPRGGQRMLGSATLHGWVESALYIQLQNEIDKDRSSKISIEREFRAAGLMPRLNMGISMGKMGEASYSVDLGEINPEVDPLILMDLLSCYPQGLNIRQVAAELGISRDKVARMVNRSNGKIISDKKGRTTTLRLGKEEV